MPNDFKSETNSVSLQNQVSTIANLTIPIVYLVFENGKGVGTLLPKLFL
jgi:hypothetical protein